ncbi:FxSxx-COOH system tetratricopeptide repeat protein [Streptomyces sp. NPDC048581]|uniref:FxSxx-COOH system tetratricopeptide repeat protein n=1 Tax=unclassified Streptomyces TaxID=2593676 RepID=UPI00371490A1
MAVGDGAFSCFISYARDDQVWAEWAAWQLADAGYAVWMDTWSLTPGTDWMDATLAAVRASGQMLVLVSPSYARSGNARAELQAAVAADKPLVPVLLSDGPFPDGLGSLRELQPLRLVGLDDRAAREALLRALSPEGPPSGGRLRRLGATSPRLPGSRPRVWNVPERYDRFVGRVDLLKQLRTALTEQCRVVLVGEPGMGKTQLAVEYAHRFAGEYELLWWIGHGRGSVPAQLAELAVRIGAASPDASPGETVRALAAELRTRNRWLLVFDDALGPGQLPEDLTRDTANGQFLVVSRARDWSGFAELVVGPLAADESYALLRTLAPTLSDQEAKVVAADMGDSPLAVGMVAGSLSGGVTIGAVLGSLSAEGPAENRPHGLRHAMRIGLEQLRAEDTRAVALLSACSLLAPEPFRLRDCVRVPDWAPEELAELLRHPEPREAALRAVNRSGLAQGGDGILRIHPATHSALRDLLSPSDRATAALGAQALLLAALPSLHAGPEAWAPLLPHLLGVAAADLTRREGLAAAGLACARLMRDGEASAAVPRLRELREAAQDTLGTDDPATMDITSHLVDALRATGEPAEALPLAEVVLAWARHHIGDEEPATLRAATQHAVLLSDVGEPAASVDLGLTTRTKIRETLGPDHPLALYLSAILLEPLRALGRREEARMLGEDTLSRQRRVLGPEHLDTLRTAAQLADLHVELGDLESALTLLDDVFQQLYLRLGPSHQATLRAATALAAPLIRVGNIEGAQRLLHATVERQAETLGADHIDTLRTTWLLACTYLLARDFDVALDYADRTYANQLRVLGAEHPDTRQGAALLAVCLQATGRTEEARTLLSAGLLAALSGVDATQAIARLLDTWSRTVGDVPEPGHHAARPSKSRSARPAASRPEREYVLVSHVEADRVWVDWITFELEQLGYEVATEAEDTHLGRPLSGESDIVLVMLSPSYLASMTATAWASEEWTELMRDDALGRRRLVPIFVHPVETERLPPVLQARTTPALYDLDPDAARDLLRFTLDEPTRPDRSPVFPGASEPDETGQALLTRRLVNALERSAVVQSREGFHALVTPLGVTVRDELTARTRLFELVRALKARPDGLTRLVDALEVLEPESLAVTEARHIVGEIERARATR